MKQIFKSGSKYYIAFDYFPSIVDAIKLIPGRAFDSTQKRWSVPESSRHHLSAFATRWEFKMPEERITAFDNFDYTIPAMPQLMMEISLKMEMYGFQKEGVAYALEKKRLIIGDQPGLGKTIQAIAAITAANAFPCLVIAPSSLKINWQREIEMWTHKDAMILSDSVKNTWKYFSDCGMAQFFITNYESLKKYFVASIKEEFDENGKKKPVKLKNVKFKEGINVFKSVIVDESHRVKEIKTLQTKLTKGICTNKEYIFLLTGTPVVNKPNDLMTQLAIIEQMKVFGGSTNFKEVFCNKSEYWKELNVLLRRNCFYRREKQDVLKQLPPKVRQAILCNITTTREYNDAMKDLEDYLKRYKQATDDEIKKSMKGEIMVRIGILKNISARGKIADVVDYVSDVVDAGEKIILFVHLKEVAEQLKRFFPAAVTITGADDAQTRQRNIDAFQKDERVQVIICSIKAAGVGITLTASSRVAFVELPWHPADCEQCEDRAHRIGQYDSVQCSYFLGKNTIDEWIYQLINEKRGMSRQITGARDEVEESVMNGVIDLLSKKNDY